MFRKERLLLMCSWDPRINAKFFPQLMVNGPIGRRGNDAVSRVVVEHRVDSELAPILLHNMEAKTALEKTNKIAPVMMNHAQVNIFH